MNKKRNDTSLDTTIADIHKIRERMLAKFNGDLKALVEDARARQEASGRPIIRLSKKRRKSS